MRGQEGELQASQGLGEHLARGPRDMGLMPTCQPHSGTWAEEEAGRTAPGRDSLHPGVTDTQHPIHSEGGCGCNEHMAESCHP